MMRRLLPLLAPLLPALAAAAPHTTQLDAALVEVRREEQVFEAYWQDVAVPVLVVRLFDDGTSRHGYAGYLCMVLSQHGIDAGTVRVVDVASSEGRELGRATCASLQRGAR
jgi:hypothetical protein